MEHLTVATWHPALSDPTGTRNHKPRNAGLTMVIDKGMGIRDYEDMIACAAPYIDFIKLGFGTAALYPLHILEQKIHLAHEHNIRIMPGGTFVEVAIYRNQLPSLFDMMNQLKFTAIEISDGTIELTRTLRSSLILQGIDAGLEVVTEYGKKHLGATIQLEELLQTVEIDTALGASLVIVEARESGKNIGIFDAQGELRSEDVMNIAESIPDQTKLMWEAPHKSQQAQLLKLLGTATNLGNIAPEDLISLEALRRGLRSDTFHLASEGCLKFD